MFGESRLGRKLRRGAQVGAAFVLANASVENHTPPVKPAAEPVIDVRSSDRDTASEAPIQEEIPQRTLSSEDEARRREHERARDKAMEELGKVLPEGFSVQVTVGVQREGEEMRGIYDEFITIRGPHGKEYGQVYVDEVDSTLIYSLSEDEQRFLNNHNQYAQQYELSTPADVSLMIDDVNSIAALEKAQDAFDAEWPTDSHIVTHEDGTMTANEEYYAAREAFAESQRSAYAELAILQEEEDDESEEDEDNEDGE